MRPTAPRIEPAQPDSKERRCKHSSTGSKRPSIYPASNSKRNRPRLLQPRGVDEPAVGPLVGPGPLPQTPAADADDILAALLVPQRPPAAPNFDPFRRPSKQEDRVLESIAGTRSATIQSQKYCKQKKEKRKSMSSVPGLKPFTEDAPNGKQIFSEREDILALQKVAGLCLFIIILSSALFLGYYLTWINERSRTSSFAPSLHNASHDQNDSLITLPVTIAAEAVE
ncbi:hypothetical protein MTO96_018690 [Rhipicephalus appendiculatus]